MKHLGDITKINGADAPVVNVIIGGSPCQDLSVAGKRAGLAGERSGLFMEQIRIIKEMREADEARGRTDEHIRPRFMVWENVPGAFSSNGGADFGAVLQETVKVACRKAPPVPMFGNKWPTSGCLTDVEGKWSVAWRVFDAQFWGVPQRRRRIALVADFGGLAAPEILFERESLSGDSEESKAARERATGLAETSSEDTVNRDDRRLSYCIQGNCIDRADTAGCNGRGWAEDMSYTLNTVDRPAVFDARGNGDGNIAPTITGNHNSRITDYSALVRQNTGMMAGAKSNQSKKIPCSWDGTQIFPTLTKSNADGRQHMPDKDNFTAVISLDRASFNQGKSAQYNFEVSESGINSSLVAKGPSAVCSVDCRNFTESGETNGTLQAKENGGMTVRRLTPLECERLQGFPDGWTDIGEWTDSKGKLHKESSDSARYKALGNSIALPSWFYVLSRLSEYCEEKTMASLFDGIGGFPLIWETLNGKGTCIWASEIEEFPIAVTKYHFGEE